MAYRCLLFVLFVWLLEHLQWLGISRVVKLVRSAFVGSWINTTLVLEVSEEFLILDVVVEEL